MRARSGQTAALALTMALLVGREVSTHQRDEYLQAARIAVQPDAFEVDLDLPPGIAVAESLIATIDTDRDGWLSAVEQRQYAEQAITALTFTFDGRPVPIRLLSSTFPDLEAFRRGEGALRLRARGLLPEVSAGAHRLFLGNALLSGQSAYLANALLPQSTRVSVTAQRRTSDQRELTIEYALAAESTSTARARLFTTLAVAAVLFVPLAAVGRRHRARMAR